MTLATPAIIIVVAVALCVPAFAAAQEPVKSFDQLNTRLKVGDTVWVTDAQGREVQGKITELHDKSITLANGARRRCRPTMCVSFSAARSPSGKPHCGVC